MEEAKALGILPEKVPQPHGGALYAGGVPGNRGGPPRTDDMLRELARMELAKMVDHVIREYYRVEAIPALCGDCHEHAVCPSCHQPVWTSAPLATPQQRVQIMDALRKIAGLDKAPIGAKQDVEPLQVHIHGAHPGHTPKPPADGTDDPPGG